MSISPDPERRIYKHVFRVVVLTSDRPDYDVGSLRELEYDITDGNFIGDFSKQSVEEVPSDRVQAELIAIDNDGHFFDVDDADDEEG